MVNTHYPLEIYLVPPKTIRWTLIATHIDCSLNVAIESGSDAMLVTTVSNYSATKIVIMDRQLQF